MPDELLPPDPSKDGWYWLSHSSKTPQVWEWCVDGAEGSWRRDSAEGSGREMALWGYALASPHPIPTPDELDALHDLEDRLSLAQRLTPDGRVILSVVLRDIRAALGSKLDDPPGESI